METPKINENCHYVQNDPHKCKIKLEKFHFDILCRYGVIKECLPGGGIRPPPPSEIGLTYFTDVLSTRKVLANLSNLLDEVESHNPDHADKVLSLYIYCTEI